RGHGNARVDLNGKWVERSMSVFVFMSFQLFASWERKKNFFQFHSIYINENPKIQFGDKEITLYNSTSELRNTDTEQVLEL
ncbi:hypothetical protein HMI56_006096, partial [Coelomomyces lativittatus]